MGEKPMGELDASVLIDDRVSFGTVLFVPPRRSSMIPGFREISRDSNGVTFAIECLVESESEWAKRCTIMTNVGTVA